MIRAEQELLELAGRDARALLLISAAYDAAQTGNDIDVARLRPHMFAADDVNLKAQLDFIAACLPRYITEWQHSQDIGDGLAGDYLRQILAELFKLRRGAYPCDCGGGTVDSLKPWAPGWVTCADCRDATVIGRPSLRLVS